MAQVLPFLKSGRFLEIRVNPDNSNPVYTVRGTGAILKGFRAIERGRVPDTGSLVLLMGPSPLQALSSP